MIDPSPPQAAAPATSTRGAAAPPWWPALTISASIAIVLVSIAFLSYGKPLAEKTLTALAMPVGGIWLLVTGRLLQLLALRRVHHSKMLLGLWLVLMVCGTRPLRSTLTHWLESSVTAYDPRRDGDLDAVVVLGGGTTSGPWRAQAAKAGDRVLMGAQLYLEGHAGQLVTTGEVTPGFSQTKVGPAEQTLEIWMRLGIPRDAIMMIGGMNTSGEIAELKHIWPRFAGKRVGLLTSATHLPRAMRLARAEQLELIPVAADVQWTHEPLGLLDFIPQADNLSKLAAVQHEIMAYFVSR